MRSEELTDHLAVARYGDFVLTDAVRPAPHLPIIPREGYRRESFREDRSRASIPVLVAAVSREKLFDLFLEILEPLGPVVDVVLETSHEHGTTHRDLLREHIDLPVLQSLFLDFEDLLLNDGCTGVAVLARGIPLEVQFDEHKLLVVYGPDLSPFEVYLADSGVRHDPRLPLITQGEHLHTTEPHHRRQFAELCCRLGVVVPMSDASALGG